MSVRRSGRKVAPVDLAAPRKDEARSWINLDALDNSHGSIRQIASSLQAATERPLASLVLVWTSASKRKAIAAYTAAIDCLDKYEPAAEAVLPAFVPLLPCDVACRKQAATDHGAQLGAMLPLLRCSSANADRNHMVEKKVSVCIMRRHLEPLGDQVREADCTGEEREAIALKACGRSDFSDAGFCSS